MYGRLANLVASDYTCVQIAQVNVEPLNERHVIDTCFRTSSFCSLKIVSDCTLFPELFKSVCIKLLVTKFQFGKTSSSQEMKESLLWDDDAMAD